MAYKIFHDYKIYDDGRIYSVRANKWMKCDITRGYSQVQLSINGRKIRYKIHRLVAFFFCNPPKDYDSLTVDHIDGNSLNNNANNLEWVTLKENNIRARKNGQNDISRSNRGRWMDDDFRAKTSHNISQGRIKSGVASGKNNHRYRFEIKDSDGNEYFMSELAKLIGHSQSYTYHKILKVLSGETVKEFADHNIIHIVDLKSKVNRLSKAKDFVPENKDYYRVITKRIE